MRIDLLRVAVDIDEAQRTRRPPQCQSAPCEIGVVSAEMKRESSSGSATLGAFQMTRWK